MSTLISGYYTSTAAARNIPLPSDCDWFKLYVQGNTAGDNWNSVANPGVIKQASWFKGMSDGTALGIYNTAGAATSVETFVATAGFQPYDLAHPPVNAAIALAAAASVSRAATAVVTSLAGHGLATGDLVRVENVTDMTQLNGQVFQITRTGATTFTIPIDTSAFAANGAGGTVTKVYVDQSFPSNYAITGITAANPGVVRVSTNHGMAVGGKVRLVVPEGFGMTQANGLLATITAVGTNTITTDIDTSAFTAFAYPVAADFPATYPQVIPVGEAPTILSQSVTNQWNRGMIVGATVVGATGSLVLWEAGKSIAVNPT